MIVSLGLVSAVGSCYQIRDANLLRELLHHLSDDRLGHAFAPDPPSLLTEVSGAVSTATVHGGEQIVWDENTSSRTLKSLRDCKL
jgi:hypothetical protein